MLTEQDKTSVPPSAVKAANLRKTQRTTTVALFLRTIIASGDFMLPTLRTSYVCLILATAALFTAGCGGGSTSANPFFIGTLPGEPASNGLNFATPMAGIPGFGDTATVRLIYLNLPANETEPSIGTKEIVIALDKRLDVLDSDLTLTIDGQDIDISNSSGNVLPDTQYFVYSDSSGSFAQMGGLEKKIGTATSESRGAFVLGFETNPIIIPTLTGSARFYDGEFRLRNVRTFQNLDPVWDGAFGTSSVTVNFDTDTVDLTLATNPNRVPGDPVFSATDIDITGNGYSGDDLTVSCNASFNCSGTGTVNGAFFGDVAQDTAGLITMEWVATNTTAIGRNEMLSVGSFEASSQ